MPLSSTEAATAIIVPVYKEDVVEVSRRLSFLLNSLAEADRLGRYHIFVLSDSPESDEARERTAIYALRETWGSQSAIFYRRRTDNSEKKAGNVKDFMERWGLQYQYICVLDADSLISARTLQQLESALEADDSLALAQSLPRIEGARTFFSRLLQWNSHVYGDIFARGFARWMKSSANFLGHNAVFRSKAFHAHCALPTIDSWFSALRGDVLSHDFVESAYLCRAGFSVKFFPEVSESYEGIPQTLSDYPARDRRWMLGNLQHMVLSLTDRQLTFFSRFQLFYGGFAYLLSFFWFALLVTSTIGALTEPVPHSYFSAPHQLFPQWPKNYSLELFFLLFGVFGLLLAPKAMSAYRDYTERPQIQRNAKAALRELIEVGGEFFLTSILAPVVMLFHVRFLLSFLVGGKDTWKPQTRVVGSSPLSFKKYINQYGWCSAIGGLWACLLLFSERGMGLWLFAVTLPLCMAPLIAYLLEHPRSLELSEYIGFWCKLVTWESCGRFESFKDSYEGAKNYQGDFAPLVPKPSYRRMSPDIYQEKESGGVSPQSEAVVGSSVS